MHLTPLRRIGRGAGALVALGYLAACSGDPTSPSAAPRLDVANGDSPQIVEVCNVGPVGTSNVFTVVADNNGGTLPLGSPTSPLIAYPTLEAVNASGCVTVWRAIYPNSPTNGAFTNVTVTDITANSPLLRIVAYDQPGGAFYREQWLEPAPVSRAVTVNVNYNYGARIYFKHDVFTPPPGCSGLTPGYWKNWSNHYTVAQFTTLLQGTIATSIADAGTILSIKDGAKSSAILKLRKFVLANQLTLNLMANPSFPNPSGGELSGACSIMGGGFDLNSALTTALQMLANPTAYSNLQILDIKDQLDAIANLGDD